MSKNGKRIDELKSQIAAFKKLINEGEPDAAAGTLGKGHKDFGQISTATRFKPGNNLGSKKTKPRPTFWKYVCNYLGMLRAEVEGMEDDLLTCAQQGAKRFALSVADGKWLQTKEILDRELGRPNDPILEDDTSRPKLVNLPFKVPG